jgi:5-enolpyruvylshikimate-3-phosphate synthase
MADLVVKHSRGLAGEITPPGDKSISHRAVMFSAIAEGSTEIDGFLTGEDTFNTAKAVRMLGDVSWSTAGDCTGFRSPLVCSTSGTRVPGCGSSPGSWQDRIFSRS